MGSATLYTLARRGVKVCGIEQFGVAHDRGSSHGQTRIIRKAYFEHPDYMPLLNRAYELWDAFEKETGQELLVSTGLMLAGKANSPTIQGLEVCYSEHAQPHERMNASEAKKRFPQFKLPKELEIFYDPLAGFLHVERCVQQHIEMAVTHGATLHTHEKVTSWQAHPEHVTVQTDRRELMAEKLIITAGAWAIRELVPLNIDCQIWRKVVFWFTSPDMSQYRLNHIPIFYVELDYGSFYGFPVIDESGLKVAEHTKPRPIGDPDKLNRDLVAEDQRDVLRFLRIVLPEFRSKLTDFSVCMYTVTPDENFILDIHPEHENVVIAAGFSGHGFKFAPVIGEIMSELTIDGSTTHPVEFLRLRRFQSI